MTEPAEQYLKDFGRCALSGCENVWSALLEPDRRYCQEHDGPASRKIAVFENWNCKRCDQPFRCQVAPLIQGQTRPSKYCSSCRRARPKPATKTLGATDMLRCPVCDRTCHRAGILHHLGKNHLDLADLRVLRWRYPALYKAIVKAAVPKLREIDRHRTKGLTKDEISLYQNNGEQICRQNVEKLLAAGRELPQTKPLPETPILGARQTPTQLTEALYEKKRLIKGQKNEYLGNGCFSRVNVYETIEETAERLGMSLCS